MTVSVFRRIGLFVVFALMPLMMASGGEAQQSTDPETVRIEKIIRNYLLEHPELLVEVMRKLEARQKAEEEAGMAGKIQANRDALFASHDDFIANPMGKFPVVEFFDYQCGYCKRFLPTMARLLETDKSVRFVFKEFPILGEVSVTASKAALAAKMQGKYLAYHNALMGLRRGLTETLVFQIAEDIGLDVARLKTDMESPEISRIIDENRKLARSMGIRGTPTIVVGEQMAPGAVSYSRLTALIEDARKNCSVC